MSKYYCLITGLPDLTVDDGKLAYTVADFKTEIYPELSSHDQSLVDLFYLRYDNANLLKLLKDKDAVTDRRGCFSPEELLDLIRLSKDNVRSSLYPAYLYEFLASYWNDKEMAALQEDFLATCYYDFAMKSKNRFVSSWFEFNLNVNNILLAFSARRYKLDVASRIIGHTAASDALRASTARDFVLSSALDYFERVQQISETADLVEREHKVDLLKWDWLDDATFFHYFSIEKVFAFLLRLDILERWIVLDKDKGNELFRKMIGTLKDEIRIPEEFRK